MQLIFVHHGGFIQCYKLSEIYKPVASIPYTSFAQKGYSLVVTLVYIKTELNKRLKYTLFSKKFGFYVLAIPNFYITLSLLEIFIFLFWQLATRNSQLQLVTRNSQLATATRNSQLQLATRNSQLATRNSQLATRNSQLATRNLQLATRNSKLHNSHSRHTLSFLTFGC